MADTVIKRVKGNRRAERMIEDMEAEGYVLDDIQTRKAAWSPVTGLFTNKQIHTLVFVRSEEE
jgi:hypothetical protein